MRKAVFVLLISTIVISCNYSSPKDYFNVAVLNVNLLHGFASGGMQQQMENPALQMINGDKDHYAAMKRKEVLDQKLDMVHRNISLLKELRRTASTEDLINASMALYEYVLPVYENEYRELARLYDDDASPNAIASLTEMINHKYFPGYAELFDKLMAVAKPYAEENHINVAWAVRMSP